MLLLTADADIPTFLPVATKLWLCAVATKISKPLNVSKTTSVLMTVLSLVLCTLPALIESGQRHTMVNTTRQVLFSNGHTLNPTLRLWLTTTS
jgi:hypothetical protein